MDAIKEFLKPEILWFLVGLALFIMELVLPGLIIAFFGVGAFVVAIVCLITDIGTNAQLIIFMASSVVSLLCLRKWLKGIFLGHVKSRQDMTKELEDIIGERAVVKEKIAPRVAGKVELHGTDWIAEADEDIAEGTTVEVVDKKNIRLKVKVL